MEWGNRIELCDRVLGKDYGIGFWAPAPQPFPVSARCDLDAFFGVRN